MLKQALPIVLLVLVFSFFSSLLIAQEVKENQDTFFLAKKKGLLGQLGKSIAKDPDGPDAVKIVNPFIVHTGKTIRNLYLLRLGFERNIFDTSVIKNNFGAIVANGLHTNTTKKVIRNNLFF